MDSERKKLPNVLKNAVRSRQNGKCVCCLKSYPFHFHHIVAIGIDKEQELKYKNIMMLCEDHHILFHQGDPDTFQMIYEYAWYIQTGELPEEMDLATISKEVHQAIRDQ